MPHNVPPASTTIKGKKMMKKLKKKCEYKDGLLWAELGFLHSPTVEVLTHNVF
jgi:hypothetical protein